MRIVCTSLLALSLLLFSTPIYAQQDESAKSTIQAWQRLINKVLPMAEDFPKDLDDFRPHPDSRSFLDEMWHITTGNGVLAARMKGERPSPDLIKISDKTKYDRKILKERLESYSKECIELLTKKFDTRSILMLAHMSEHYGKLVTIYRMNNLVPPNSQDN